MFLRQHTPHPALRHFVRSIVIDNFQLDASCPRPVSPFPPQPEHRLYFYPYNKIICRNYADNTSCEMPHSIIVGPQLSRVDLTMGYNMLVVMVNFQPGGLHRLLRIPMHEILDLPLDASLILGKEIVDVTEQLTQATDHEKMITILEQFLLRKAKALKPILPFETVLEQMLASRQITNVDQLAKQACVSNRQLERQFKERTGLPPKVFTRLVRFSNAWVLREQKAHLSWSSIAHLCGYADQMHMIRDFKDFAGVSPRILQSELEKSHLRLQGIATAP